MANTGRPRALDEAKRREICALVSAGAGMRRAAQYVGCSQSTISREAQRDQDFREQLRRAKATNNLAPLQAMKQAMQSSWRAAAWMLERSDPRQYGRAHRDAFGRRELKALARDLVAIIYAEIEHPMQRERVVERIQATLNYAMHHAWDANRTGRSLSRAMGHFAKKQEANDAWSDFDFALDQFTQTPLPSTACEQSIASSDETDFAKVAPVKSSNDLETTENSASVHRADS